MENQNTSQNSGLKTPPTAGGPRRLAPGGRPTRSDAGSPAKGGRERERVAVRRRPQQKSWLKRSLPYLVPGVATGGAIGLSFTDLLPF